MKFYKIGDTLIYSGAIFWILETIYFGFNIHPESQSELYCDKLSSMLMEGGVICYVVIIFKALTKWEKENK